MRFSLLGTLLLLFVLPAGAMAQRITVRIDAGTLDKAFQQIKFLIIQCDFSLFQAGHVQDIVDQLQKLSAGKTDLLQVIRHFFLVPDICACQVGKAYDGV